MRNTSFVLIMDTNDTAKFGYLKYHLKLPYKTPRDREIYHSNRMKQIRRDLLLDPYFYNIILENNKTILQTKLDRLEVELKEIDECILKKHK
jgi:hypothetical protein